MTGAEWFHCEKGDGGRGIVGMVQVNCMYLVEFGKAVLCACVYSKFTFESLKDCGPCSH